ncbi:glycoside hydrolase family 19 protein [Deinococcus sp. Leaf326]|uniref:glycoside hydrolase family 19 protein n=1 Tax=Deinococcus sp. Leaf326 TaxID=1736338 RepID=UPI000AA4F694|nr:glycoside hydrolase family 19 protein [Deinococcus sp. Leaf326]
MIDTKLIKLMAPGCKNPELVEQKLNQLLPAYGINTKLRLLHFLSQVAHESEFNPVSENLNYSAKRLLQVFPKYFPTAALAASYAGNPTAIGSRVYANRLGNGNEASREGYLYRGRGMLQLTGKSNYLYYGKRVGQDLVANPDLALQYGVGVQIAGVYFLDRGILPFCDSNNIREVTRRVNGGYNGLEDRISRFNKGARYLA